MDGAQHQPKPFNLYSFNNSYATDISGWLQLFGFQLHNVVPGYPKPEMESMEQTYAMIRTQTKTQDWDPSKVLLGIQCELPKHLKNLITLDRLPMSKVSAQLGAWHSWRPRFSAISSIFSKDVKFAIRDDVVIPSLGLLARTAFVWQQS